MKSRPHGPGGTPIQLVSADRWDTDDWAPAPNELHRLYDGGADYTSEGGLWRGCAQSSVWHLGSACIVGDGCGPDGTFTISVEWDWGWNAPRFRCTSSNPQFTCVGRDGQRRLEAPTCVVPWLGGSADDRESGSTSTHHFSLQTANSEVGPPLTASEISRSPRTISPLTRRARPCETACRVAQPSRGRWGAGLLLLPRNSSPRNVNLRGVNTDPPSPWAPRRPPGAT